MAQLSHELETFLLYDPEKSVSTVHVSVAQPTPLEARTFGQLFVLTELGSRAPMNTELIGILQEEMRRAYYQGPQLRIETAFEQALQHVNEQLKHLVESGMTDWLDHFNIVMGVLKDQTLILTHIGQIQASMIHRGRIVDVVESAGPEERKVNPLKIFSNIITGEVQEDDYLIFFTPSLLDYLSLEKLKRIVLDRPPLDAVRHLEELLSEAPPRTAFGTLISHAVAATDTNEATATVSQMSPSVLTVQTRSSMDDLIAREEATQRLLTPSLWLVARRFFLTLFNSVKPAFSSLKKDQVKSHQSERLRSSNSETPDQRTPISSRHLIPASLTSISAQGGRAVARSVQTVFQKRRTFWTALRLVPAQLASAIARLIAAFPKWSFRQKALFIAIIALLFFFAQSIVSMGRRSENDRVETDRRTIITAIEQKRFDAEAALSYDDEERASRLIGEAADLLATLETDSNTNDKTLQALRDSIEAIREQTRHLISIADPTRVADLSESISGGGPSFIVLGNDFLYANNGTADEILKITLADGAIERVESPLEASETLRLGAQFGQSVLFSDGQDGFFDLTKTTNRTRSLSFTSVNVDRTIQALATFQSRAYLLDSQNNQIFRYQLGASGFGVGVAWIQDENTNLAQAVSLAVDGSLYLLDSNGNIRRFTQGRLDDFALDPVDPPLTSGTKVWTDEEADRIYLIDAASKRLILYSKSGQFQVQYTSPAFSELRDVAVDEAGNRAYVLCGNSVFSLDLATQ